jgi:hypothetical protein
LERWVADSKSTAYITLTRTNMRNYNGENGWRGKKDSPDVALLDRLDDKMCSVLPWSKP